MKPIAARDMDPSMPLLHFMPLDLERFSRIVVDHQIYFSRPAAFNDPFEVSPVFDLNVSGLDSDALYRIVGDCVDANRRLAGHALIARGGSASGLDLRAILDRGGAELSALLQDTYRVFCLSTQLRAVRMWSHYAAKHQGVALAFSNGDRFFGNALAVEYCDTPETIDPKSIETASLDVRPFVTKASSWRDEREYRLIGSDTAVDWAAVIRTEGGLAAFPPKELMAVYVGCNMPESCVRAVINEARHSTHVVPVRTMIKAPNSLSLEWKQIA